jgi:RimJ/RimL family protein N-acetyltransferase
MLQLVPKTASDAQAMVEAMSPADRAQVSPEWLARIYAPDVDAWTLGYTVIRTADGVHVGQCGFKGPPKAGVVEIAYCIEPDFEGRGYATEAARALVAIAFASPEVRTVIAHTIAATNASSRVLQKAGFRNVGEVIDPEDGVVWRWERPRES